jgi:hypothetical protein
MSPEFLFKAWLLLLVEGVDAADDIFQLATNQNQEYFRVRSRARAEYIGKRIADQIADSR